MNERHQKALLYLAGVMAGIHDAVKKLEDDGLEGLDPVACAMEDMGDLLMGLVLDETVLDHM